MSSPALILIGYQNDYFPGGQFPLWNMEAVLEKALDAIERARKAGIPIILVQQVVGYHSEMVSFFIEGTKGVELHSSITEMVPEAPIVMKGCGDCFQETNLDEILQEHKIDTLYIGGMMTQACVTFSAISKVAQKYDVCVLFDLCTSVGEVVNDLALEDMAFWVKTMPSSEAF
ncbi:cysteine hydrolase family protein [Endozoicomonas arenosclerae]|uniref:cysteine hydrolase family protein n=1 Tax=Endozoicomonas arenosclerae TaxID=1633495 RepID=UPI000784F5AC|nr:isochorismatase family cysteine hydrolase [Endozoicomonas arenosclerae]